MAIVTVKNLSGTLKAVSILTLAVRAQPHTSVLCRGHELLDVLDASVNLLRLP